MHSFRRSTIIHPTLSNRITTLSSEEDGAALVETHSAHTRIGSALDRADALLRRLKVVDLCVCLCVCVYVCMCVFARAVT